MLKKLRKKKSLFRIMIPLMLCCIIFFAVSPSYVRATGNSGVDSTTQGEIDGEPDNDDDFNLSISSNAGSTSLEATLQILIALTILALAPSILVLLTSFTRIIVVFHFLRTAIGTQTTPPNQVLAGLALFITFAIMTPVFTDVYEDAVKPYMSGQIKEEAALDQGIAPLKEFMLKQTREKDLKLFMDMNHIKSEDMEEVSDIPILTVIPAFVLSEHRAGFIIGFLLYLPFIVMDMVVASTLMSMGMMMLPPTVISLPFKILLFVLADGWNLVVGQLVKSFQ